MLDNNIIEWLWSPTIRLDVMLLSVFYIYCYEVSRGIMALNHDKIDGLCRAITGILLYLIVLKGAII